MQTAVSENGEGDPGGGSGICFSGKIMGPAVGVRGCVHRPWAFHSLTWFSLQREGQPTVFISVIGGGGILPTNGGGHSNTIKVGQTARRGIELPADGKFVMSARSGG